MKALLLAPLLVVLSACAAQNQNANQQSTGTVSDDSGTPSSGKPTAPPTDAQVALTIDEVVSCFENSTKTIQYGYIEALDDGRGYTAGKAGFTTGTGDLVEVVQRYLDQTSNAGLQAILPTLQKYSDEGSGSVQGLSTLPALWTSLSKTAAFRAAQDAETDELYTQPAMNYVKKYKLATNLAKLVFYDTIIQHGDGSDPDGFRGVLSKMSAKPKDEKTFLMNFLEARRAVLMNPSDSSTTQAWRESVDRVNALERLVTEGQWTLAPPFKVTVYGDTYPF